MFSRPIFAVLERIRVSEEQKQIAKNLYLSGINEEFVAMQLDLEIPIVIRILTEEGIYKGS